MATGSDCAEPPSKTARKERLPPPLTMDIVDASKLKTLTLWIVLTRAQFESMMTGNEVVPDAYSGRFGLRRTMFKAVQRTKAFIGWKSKEEREYLAMRIEISPLGYMRKMEQGILIKCRPGEYRWMGGIYGQENDEDGEWLYRIIGNAYHFACEDLVMYVAESLGTVFILACFGSPSRKLMAWRQLSAAREERRV